MRYIIELAYEASGIFPKTLKQALDILGYDVSLNEHTFHIYNRRSIPII